MPDDNGDHQLSEPPEFPHERKGSMSFAADGDDVSPGPGPANGDSPNVPVQPDHNAKAVHDVVNSEIGVATLLNRLKQSIASAKVRTSRYNRSMNVPTDLVTL